MDTPPSALRPKLPISVFNDSERHVQKVVVMNALDPVATLPTAYATQCENEWQ